LVELLVVIAIIGTLMALLLPAVQSARESGRSNACRSNLTNLQRAMTAYEVNEKQYPGYVNAVGIVGKVSASWGAMMLPHIEQRQLWDTYASGKPAAGTIEIYICPSDPPQAENTPAMSYLANAGWIQDEGIKDEGDGCAPKENPANGLFFDRTRGGSDVRDLNPPCKDPELDPILRMDFASVQAQGDGSTHTLMFAEGINADVWTGISAPDKKWHYGFCWEDPQMVATWMSEPPSSSRIETGYQYRRINGITEQLPSYQGDKAPNSGFPSSNHPGGINVAFVGGQVVNISNNINPVVYAQLMTSNRKLSNLVFDEVLDREMPTPGPDQY
jgi:prepilin-type processing-associated H-X9-DG protein